MNWRLILLLLCLKNIGSSVTSLCQKKSTRSKFLWFSVEMISPTFHEQSQNQNKRCCWAILLWQVLTGHFSCFSSIQSVYVSPSLVQGNVGPFIQSSQYLSNLLCRIDGNLHAFIILFLLKKIQVGQTRFHHNSNHVNFLNFCRFVFWLIGGVHV